MKEESIVVGNCSKHPGHNFVNCPLCDIEKQQKLAKQFWNNVMRKKPLCLTTWNAILQIESEHKKSLRVSDPECKDAGQYISWDDVKAIFRFKPFLD